MSIKLKNRFIPAYYAKTVRNSSNTLRSLSLPVLPVVKSRPFLRIEVVYDVKTVTRSCHPTNRFVNNAIGTFV